MAWTVEQVAALAPSPSQFAAADDVAEATRWSALAAAEGAIWGRYVAGRGEPYDTAVDVNAAALNDGEPRWRCSCPSRKRPCKHALGLMLLWVRHHVPVVGPSTMPPQIRAWIERGRPAPAAGQPSTSDSMAGSPVPHSGPGADDRAIASGGGSGSPDTDVPPVPDGPGRPPEPSDRGDRDDRVARMRAGLVELSRWLEDRVRTGLSDPSLARYETWDGLAARLVDAQVGALANRVRRLAGLIGTSPGWHERLLAELGILHLLARAGRRLPELPPGLGDGVATAIGWQVRHATVLAGVPDTDVWDVAGRSDTREDRIVVRRTWLHGRTSGRWAMVLSFAAYQQALDTSLPVGSVIVADVHRFPGSGVRALVGRRHAGDEQAPAPQHVPDPVATPRPPIGGVVDAAAEIGLAVIAEPWTEHVPVTLHARLTTDGGRWVLSDGGGSLPCMASDRAVAAALAATGGRLAAVTAEWTPTGLLPLTVRLDDRALDIGPRADPDFVSAA